MSVMSKERKELQDNAIAIARLDGKMEMVKAWNKIEHKWAMATIFGTFGGFVLGYAIGRFLP